MELSFDPSDGEVACIRLTILQKTIINSTQNNKEKISLFENTKESPKASRNQREFSPERRACHLYRSKFYPLTLQTNETTLYCLNNVELPRQYSTAWVVYSRTANKKHTKCRSHSVTCPSFRGKFSLISACFGWLFSVFK